MAVLESKTKLITCYDGWINPSMGTLKPQSNGPLYTNTVIGTLAIHGGLLHLVQCE